MQDLWPEIVSQLQEILVIGDLLYQPSISWELPDPHPLSPSSRPFFSVRCSGRMSRHSSSLDHSLPHQCCSQHWLCKHEEILCFALKLHQHLAGKVETEAGNSWHMSRLAQVYQKGHHGASATQLLWGCLMGLSPLDEQFKAGLWCG